MIDIAGSFRFNSYYYQNDLMQLDIFTTEEENFVPNQQVEVSSKKSFIGSNSKRNLSFRMHLEEDAKLLKEALCQEDDERNELDTTMLQVEPMVVVPGMISELNVENQQESTTQLADEQKLQQQLQQQLQQSFEEEEDEEDEEEDISPKEANWFLEVLESYNQSSLSSCQLEKLQKSKLRNKIKHRVSILFEDDINFIFHTQHNFKIEWDNIHCKQDPKKWIIHKLCKFVAQHYKKSIEIKSGRSCIWSALMDRALYHLQESGFTDSSIELSNSSNRETTLFVGNYYISRCNFTKVFKKYC